VSSVVLDGIAGALGAAPGRALLDIGGGTGNYAAALREQGWIPTILDASPQMRGVAEAKGVPVIAGEATSLPFADVTFDAVSMISMLHQVGDWRRALREARRVLRSDGSLAVMLLTAENIREVTWAFDLFPIMRERALPHRPSQRDLLDELPDATITPFWLQDLSDASIGALCAFPDAMLHPRLRRQTSFFEYLEREQPQQLKAGLKELRAALKDGRSPVQERADARRRLGDGSIISWQRPPGLHRHDHAR
jgi:demethylmenaquinone methyltransferase/2-methoxy-6-polyprenyl-1,4-benzoquinol methylase